MFPKRLSILGTGLLGGSIGLAVRSRISNCEITGYGHRAATRENAVKIGAVDQSYDNPCNAVRDCDLVILATPVGVFESLLHMIAPALSPGAIVTDVGSTKRNIVQLAEKILPAHAHFIGSHPIAGSEKRGVDFARADLFENAQCLITPTSASHAEALVAVEGFWRQLGMRTLRLSPAAHDQYLADISHLPHAVAAALVLMQSQAALDLAGKGFVDTTRIASGDPGLWRDIFLDNRDNLRHGAERLRENLDRLIQMLDQGDGAAISQWLEQASRRRDELLQKKLKELGS